VCNYILPFSVCSSWTAGSKSFLFSISLCFGQAQRKSSQFSLSLYIFWFVAFNKEKKGKEEKKKGIDKNKKEKKKKRENSPEDLFLTPLFVSSSTHFLCFKCTLLKGSINYLVKGKGRI
jgi:hypothetical protein